MRQKKLLSLVLTVALVLGCVTIPTSGVFAAETANGAYEGFAWSFDEASGTLKIDGKGDLTGNWNVDYPWKAYQNSIKKVELSKGITSIGKYLFQYSEAMESISIPNTVTEIQYGAFDHCKALKKVALPSSLKKIDTGAFIFCSSLSEVKISGGANNTKLDSIGLMAFAGCKKLKSLTIPKYVTDIGGYAFGYDLKDGMTYNPVKISGVKIYGIKKTTAQTYAKKNKITFKSAKDNGKWPNPKLKTPSLSLSIEFIDSKKFHHLEIGEVSGATGYQIYYSFSNKKNSWGKAYTIKQSSYRGYTVSWGGEGCYYKVRAYKKAGPKYFYSPFSKVKHIK